MELFQFGFYQDFYYICNCLINIIIIFIKNLIIINNYLYLKKN